MGKITVVGAQGLDSGGSGHLQETTHVDKLDDDEPVSQYPVEDAKRWDRPIANPRSSCRLTQRPANLHHAFHSCHHGRCLWGRPGRRLFQVLLGGPRSDQPQRLELWGSRASGRPNWCLTSEWGIRSSSSDWRRRSNSVSRSWTAGWASKLSSSSSTGSGTGSGMAPMKWMVPLCRRRQFLVSSYHRPRPVLGAEARTGRSARPQFGQVDATSN